MLPLLSALLLTVSGGFGSDTAEMTGPTKVVTFAFWNVENLFDFEDDPTNPGDDEFLPRTGWTPDRYRRKLIHLSEIIAGLDCHILGLAEVENRRVLEDLIQGKKLRRLGYRIAHRESPDKRGIDLALLYRSPFRLASGEKSIVLHPIPIDPPTRGILEVQLAAGIADESSQQLPCTGPGWYCGPTCASGIVESVCIRRT